MSKKIKSVSVNVLFLLAAFVFYTCGNSKNTVQQSYSDMIGTIIDTSDTGVFRGLILGAKYAEVAKKENKKYLVKKDSTMLRYKIQISDSVQYDITYQFHKKALNNIAFVALLPSEKDGNKMTQLFIEKYSQLYNKPKTEKGYISWHTADSLYIQLINNSEQYGYGMVQLFIYKDFSSNYKSQTDTTFKSPFL